MAGSNSFFARKEQSDFIQRVYREAPPIIQKFFAQENKLLESALSGCPGVLEVGCGFGREAELLPEITHYYGIDIGLKYVVEAKVRFPGKNWICANAARLPFSDHTFDAAFLVQNTLGNMEGVEEQVFSECLRVVRSGGKLIVSVYSEDSFEIRRLWYDRLIDLGIFGRVWLASPKIARSDTGWSSRCFEREELKAFFASGIQALEITKIDSFFYFCVGVVA